MIIPDWIIQFLPYLGTILGTGGILKLIELWMNRSQSIREADVVDRADWRTDVAALREDMREMREDYRKLEKEFELKKLKIDELEAEVVALKKQRLEQDYKFHEKWWQARTVFDQLLNYIRKSPSLSEDEEFTRLEASVGMLYAEEERRLEERRRDYQDS